MTFAPLLLASLAIAAPTVPYGGAFKAECSSYSESPTQAQKQLIALERTNWPTRVSHFLWYALPASWPEFSPEQRQFFRELLPAYVPPARVSGADFFDFHYQALSELFSRFHAKGLPCMKPWSKIPAQGEWPPMTGGFNASLHIKLSQAFDRLVSPEWLKSKSLDETAQEARSALFQPLLAAYTPPAPGTFTGCGLDLDRLASAPGTPGTDPALHCEDPHNDWLGSALSAPANPLSYQISAVMVEVMTAWENAHPGSKKAPAQWRVPPEFERNAQTRLRALAASQSAADHAKNLPSDLGSELEKQKEKLRGIVMTLSLYRWR